MAILGCNLKEVEHFTNEVSKVMEKLNADEKYLYNVLNHHREYDGIKNFFVNFVKFLTYRHNMVIDTVYRVRKCIGDSPFLSKKELMYPPPNIDHKDRMNNTSFRVLYTSFNEFTAMAETKIDEFFLGGYFQLTRFSIEKPISVFKLGMFSELYLNIPRDSEEVKNAMIHFFGSQEHDSTIRGFSALECAMADILYGVGDNHHILSSLLADAIFSTNLEVDAIMYPSMQNRYGMNLAIKQQFADSMKIDSSFLNCVDEVFSNGFYKYSTVAKCIDFSDEENLSFTNIQEPYFTKTYR